MSTPQPLRTWAKQPINSVPLPIEISDSARAEISHRLNNRLQVILSAAHMILSDSQEDETRPRAKAIHTAARGIVEDINELFGPGISGDTRRF